MQINLPHNFTYRNYQEPQFIAAAEGKKRFYKVWHRRAGKDLTDFNFIVCKAFERVGLYWHMLPEYNQARKAIWQGMNKDGKKFTDYVPRELAASINNQEMKITLINGSIIQIVGSDNIDSLVGTNPIGVVFSEFALTNPRAWPLIEPILLENDGWAVFNTTPRGKNHAYDLWTLAEKNPKWFTQRLTIDDTRNAEGKPLITAEMISELRAMGTDEETIQQEYYCSFEGSLQGAYYAEQIKWLEDNRRITAVPYIEELPVKTYWDIGISDYTTIWFVQTVGAEFRVIDYLQRNGQPLSYYAKELQGRGYLYAEHILPHDAGHQQITTGKSICAQMEDLLPKQEFTVQKRTSNVNADIMAVRAFMKRCVFDETKCKDGLQALRSYTKKWSDTKNSYDDKPLHDWASHGADSFRYFAIHNADEYDMSDSYDYDNLTKPKMVINTDDFSLNDYL